MEAIIFVKNYMDYLQEISSVIKPELLPIIDELRLIDPHDLVQPEIWFHSESEAKGFVWKMFIKRVKQIFFPINQVLPVLIYFFTFVKSESGLLNGSDKKRSEISLNNHGFEAGTKCVSPGIIHN